MELMNNFYEHCPLCGNTLIDNNTVCNKCGFANLEIDINGTNDIDIIRKEQERRKMKVWDTKLLILITVLAFASIALAYFISYNSDSIYSVYYSPFDSSRFVGTFILILIIFTIISCFVGIMFYQSNLKKINGFINERNHIISSIKIEEEKIRKETEDRKQKEAHRNLVNITFDKYGMPDKLYHDPTSSKEIIDFEKDIAIFGKSNHLMAYNKFYPFSSIIGCNLSDKKRIVHGMEKSKTRTKTSDALITSAFALMNETEWTMASGLIARKETITEKGDDVEVHDYTLFVNVNNLTNPTIKIHIGNSDEIANELMGIINVIITQNKK